MFREIILPIFRSTRLCVTACGIMQPRCCRLSAWSALKGMQFDMMSWRRRIQMTLNLESFQKILKLSMHKGLVWYEVFSNWTRKTTYIHCHPFQIAHIPIWTSVSDVDMKFCTSARVTYPPSRVLCLTAARGCNSEWCLLLCGHI